MIAMITCNPSTSIIEFDFHDNHVKKIWKGRNWSVLWWVERCSFGMSAFLKVFSFVKMVEVTIDNFLLKVKQAGKEKRFRHASWGTEGNMGDEMKVLRCSFLYGLAQSQGRWVWPRVTYLPFIFQVRTNATCFHRSLSVCESILLSVSTLASKP